MAQHGLIAATSQPTGVDKSPTIFFSTIESDSGGIHKKIMNGPFFGMIRYILPQPTDKFLILNIFSSDSPDLLGLGYPSQTCVTDCKW